MANINSVIKDNNVVVFIVSSQSYLKKVIDTTVAASKVSKNLCFISLNKSYDEMIPAFKKADINTNKVIFIDAVKGEMKQQKGVVFVSSPKALTELSIAIIKSIEHADFFQLDSLSTLTMYQEQSVVLKFIHSIVSKIQVAEKKLIIISLEKDMNTEMAKDLNMFVDKIVKI
jgi:hypothetical protein